MRSKAAFANTAVREGDMELPSDLITRHSQSGEDYICVSCIAGDFKCNTGESRSTTEQHPCPCLKLLVCQAATIVQDLV